MEKYKWSPQKIDQEDYFKTLDLEFGEWNSKTVESDVVYEYADQLPF